MPVTVPIYQRFFNLPVSSFLGVSRGDMYRFACDYHMLPWRRQFREGEQNQLAEAKSTLASMAALG